MSISVCVGLLFVLTVLGCTRTVVVDEHFNCGTSGCEPFSTETINTDTTTDTDSLSDTATESTTEMDTEAVRCAQLDENECDLDGGCVSGYGFLFNDTDSCVEEAQFVWCMKSAAGCTAGTNIMLDSEGSCWNIPYSCTPFGPGWEIAPDEPVPPDCYDYLQFDNCP